MNPSVTKIKQARRMLLEALNMVYPSGLRQVSLLKVIAGIDPDYERDLLVKDLAYLREKQYIEAVGEQLAVSWDGRVVKLTAAGNEIATSIRSDPALEI